MTKTDIKTDAQAGRQTNVYTGRKADKRIHKQAKTQRNRQEGRKIPVGEKWPLWLPALRHELSSRLC